MPTVTFAFDPTCPWTWTTSRWLQDEVAPARDLHIEWRAFSLELLSPDWTCPRRGRRSVAAR